MDRVHSLIQALRPPRRFESDARCWISFGGNVGDVKATFDAALALLSLHPQIQVGRRSGLYSTAPMGSDAGKAFINSVCELTTTLDPFELLNVLQKIENQLGRVRDVRWGPRTLDLDILSYGERALNEPDLVLPHPAVTYRKFVLVPLMELADGWVHPVCQLTATQMAERLEASPLKVRVIDVDLKTLDQIKDSLIAQFPALTFDVPSSDSRDGVLICVGTDGPCATSGPLIDLSRSPGDVLEKLTSAFTAIFDSPIRISDW